MADILTQILETKKSEIARGKESYPMMFWEKQITQNNDTPRSFAKNLMHGAQKRGGGVIAEIKKASPSKGLLRRHFDVAALAKACQVGGADTLSVLTDEQWFQGSKDNLRIARQASHLPILRKDFIIDEWQIYESRAWGADCILLIMAALSDKHAHRFESLAHHLGMDVLVESHDEEELQRALRLKTPLIGVNNRNLKTLVTDLRVGTRLLDQIPKNRFAITESGMATKEDFHLMRAHNAKGFLVGESIMVQKNVTSAVEAITHAIGTFDKKITRKHKG